MTEPTNSTDSNGSPSASTDEVTTQGTDSSNGEEDSNPETASQTRSAAEYHDSWYRNGTMRQEVQKTVREQVNWIGEINEKALGMLRFNATILGLVVPSLSFAVEFQLVSSTAAFYTPEMIAGVATLVASTAMAGVTYTSSSMETGISDTDVETAARRELTDAEVHDELVRSYADWVESNRLTLRRNSTLVTVTVGLNVIAIVFLSLGFAVALFGGLPEYVEYAAYAGLVLLLVGSQSL